MTIRTYNKALDETSLMAMIKAEEGWDYADEPHTERYKQALDTSITYVAYMDNDLCGYSRSLSDGYLYLFVCDLLVMPAFRGRDIGRGLMECLYQDNPDFTAYVMSGVDEYYEKLEYKKEGSIFEVKKRTINPKK